MKFVINTSFYISLIAKAFGRADTTWLIGVLVPEISYYFPLLNKEIYLTEEKETAL